MNWQLKSLRQLKSNRTFGGDEIMATEHSKCGYCTWGTEFLFKYPHVVSSYCTGPWRFRGNLGKSLLLSFLWSPLPTNSSCLGFPELLPLSPQFRETASSAWVSFPNLAAVAWKLSLGGMWGHDRAQLVCFSLLSGVTVLCYPLSNIRKQFLKYILYSYLFKAGA